MTFVVRFILPMKELRRAKSRLQVPKREALIEAMLRDTLEAVLAADAGPVILVSPDQRVAGLADEYPVGYVAHDGSLNEAISVALTADRCAVVLPDLPALRPADVRRLAGAESGFVPDAAGTGTTMAIAGRLNPVFGRGSARSFAAQGLPLLQARDSARCDVDDAKGLSRAVALGVGRHTRAVLNA